VTREEVFFKGNIVSPDGKDRVEIEKHIALADASNLGLAAAKEILLKGGDPVVQRIRNKGLTIDGDA
jgi:hydroxymethylbilane synthase